MALIEHNNRNTTFLIAHDNKKKEQVHAAILTVEGSKDPKYSPLKWMGADIPVDIEAATSVPDVPRQYALFTSAGRVYHVRLNLAAGRLELIRSFDVPSIPQKADFEGFALQRLDGILLAVWAERGLTEKPATVFWGRIDIATGKFSDLRTSAFKVPFPLSNVRHISDIKVDATGAVFVTAASDPGNDGPFSSAMYYAGVLEREAKKSFVFIRSSLLTRIYRLDDHKVEAFEFIPGSDGGIAFGTDDENLGASLFTTY
ncbi:MAG: hypothetical protein ACRD6X_10595 [Pyrinomonadaceae bacterium]